MGPKKAHKKDDSRQVDFEFSPKTPLGKRLWEIRKKYVASGEPLLDWDEIEKEVKERRGGVE